jgi:hypothetical protein
MLPNALICGRDIARTRIIHRGLQVTSQEKSAAERSVVSVARNGSQWNHLEQNSYAYSCGVSSGPILLKACW